MCVSENDKKCNFLSLIDTKLLTAGARRHHRRLSAPAATRQKDGVCATIPVLSYSRISSWTPPVTRFPIRANTIRRSP